MVVLSSAAPSAAGTATNALSVSLFVGPQCSVGPSVMDFGAYDPIALNLATPLTVSGSIQLACSNGVAATISLDNGLYASHAIGATRSMSGGGANYLSYELYTSAARATVWNAANTVAYTGAGSRGTVTVYGSIPAGQTGLPSASYSDTVGITVSF